jgi:hypothetical protein
LDMVEAEVAHVDRTTILTKFKPKTELGHDLTSTLDTLEEQKYA